MQVVSFTKIPIQAILTSMRANDLIFTKKGNQNSKYPARQLIYALLARVKSSVMNTLVELAGTCYVCDHH